MDYKSSWEQTRVAKLGIDRKTVIEAYARYDRRKKGLPALDLTGWNWSSADMIDEEMRRAELKPGILAGYQLWDEVTISMMDLRECAVEEKVIPESVTDAWTCRYAFACWLETRQRDLVVRKHCEW